MSAINVGEVYYFLRKTSQRGTGWDLANFVSNAACHNRRADSRGDLGLSSRAFTLSHAPMLSPHLSRKSMLVPLVTGDFELRSIHSLKLDWIGRTAT